MAFGDGLEVWGKGKERVELNRADGKILMTYSLLRRRRKASKGRQKDSGAYPGDHRDRKGSDVSVLLYQ